MTVLETELGVLEPTLPNGVKAEVSVLLVDDQPIIAEGVRQMLEGQTDIVFHYCQDPAKAIKMAEEVHPTVILQDLVMPEIDGLLLVRYFRANPKTHDVPMIVLSAEEQPAIKAEAFKLGANDYMVKLPDKIELLARIRYHSKSYMALMQRNEAYEKIEASRNALNRDLADAADYVVSILPKPLDDSRILTKWCYISSASLGGDSFGYHWLDDDHFAIYLLDVCGHGVGAALLSTSVTNVLRFETLPNTDFYQPDKVLKSLNETFQMERHRNMFFSMWYGVYQPSVRELVYSSGGHPPAILITGANRETALTQRLRTIGMVVGGISDSKFECGVTQVESFNRFYLFSDGVFEVFNQGQRAIELDDVIKVMEEQQEGLDVDGILRYCRNFNGPGPFSDDFSILGITFK